MSATLVSDLTGLFRNQALGEAAAQLNEPENSVIRGFQTASAAIVGSLASHTGQPGFMRQAFELISSPLNDSKILDNVRGFFSNRVGSESEGLGKRMLSMLFGGDQSKVADGISQASGLRPNSAATMMGVAAPIVLGALGKRVKDEHMDSSGLSNFLQSENSEVRTILPAGLMSSVTTPAQGAAAAIADTGRNVTSRARDGVERVEVSRPGSGRWIWPLLLLAIAIGLIAWLFNRSREAGTAVVHDAANTAQKAANAVQSTASNAAQSTAATLGSLYHRALPGGADLNIPQHGMETQLLAFIEDPSKPVSDTTWFEFDRLSFDTNSATLRPESQEQLNNIAAILKAYPNVRIKIGGYTDNTGDPAANMQLSQQRADAVMQQLISLGVATDRMAAQGYGDQHPIGDNSTPEGRAKNRRIAINVTQK